MLPHYERRFEHLAASHTWTLCCGAFETLLEEAVAAVARHTAGEDDTIDSAAGDIPLEAADHMVMVAAAAAAVASKEHLGTLAVVQNEVAEHCTNRIDPAAVAASDSVGTAGHTEVVVAVAVEHPGTDSESEVVAEVGLGGPESRTPPCLPNP